MENEKKEWRNEKTGKVEKYNYGRRPIEKVKHAEAIEAADEALLSPDAKQLLALADFYLTDKANPVDDSAIVEDAKQGYSSSISPKLDFTLETNPKQKNQAKQKQSNAERAKKQKTTAEKTKPQTSAAQKSKNQGNKHKSTSSNHKKRSEESSKQEHRLKENEIVANPIHTLPADLMCHQINTNERTENGAISNPKVYSQMPAFTQNKTVQTSKNGEKMTRNRNSASISKNKKQSTSGTNGQTRINWEEEERLSILAAKRDGTIAGLIMCFVMAVTFGLHMLVAQFIPSISPNILVSNVANEFLSWIFGIAIDLIGC
jgi:hypothetical protein